MASRAALLDCTNQTPHTQNEHLKRRAETDSSDGEASGKRVKTSEEFEEDQATCDNDADEPLGAEEAHLHPKAPPMNLYSSLRALRMGNPVARRNFTCKLSKNHF